MLAAQHRPPPHNGSLDQTITTVVGQLYHVDFWLANIGNLTPPANAFSASFAGVTFYSVVNAPVFPYTDFSANITATSTSSDLHFEFNNTPGPKFPDPNGRADLFGGLDGQFYQLSMWQWTGSDWMQFFPSTVPFARSSAAVAANPLTGEVVMFGGLGDVNPNNTWTYDGMTWTLQSPLIQPPLVYASSAAFDPGVHALVLFAGGSGGVERLSSSSGLLCVVQPYIV